jgi:hypothetical protein
LEATLFLNDANEGEKIDTINDIDTINVLVDLNEAWYESNHVAFSESCLHSGQHDLNHGKSMKEDYGFCIESYLVSDLDWKTHLNIFS